MLHLFNVGVQTVVLYVSLMSLASGRDMTSPVRVVAGVVLGMLLLMFAQQPMTVAIAWDRWSRMSARMERDSGSPQRAVPRADFGAGDTNGHGAELDGELPIE
jgi:hypothetical protein